MIRTLLTVALVLCIFGTVSVLATQHQVWLSSYIVRGGTISLLSFTLLTALFVVFVIPLDLVFLIPIGTAVFGPTITAALTICGWTLGAAIAFMIARQWGRPVVGRIINLKRLATVESRLPAGDLFWTVVGLRLLISVDILSYALGLMSTMRFHRYVLATLIGVTPFGIFFAYTDILPLPYRLATIGGAFILVSLIFWRQRQRSDTPPVDNTLRTPV